MMYNEKTLEDYVLSALPEILTRMCIYRCCIISLHGDIAGFGADIVDEDVLRREARMKKIFLVLGAVMLLAAVTVSAHPHVFIKNSIEIVCNTDGIAGVRNVWEFDEIFSKTIIEEYDLDKNGSFDEKERKDVYENAFINIKNFNFYTHVIFKGKKINHAAVTDFRPRISGNAIIYEFFVPLDITLSASQHVDFCIYDDSYFIAFTDPEGKVILDTPADRNYTFSIIKNDDQSGYGSSYPSIIRVKPEK